MYNHKGKSNHGYTHTQTRGQVELRKDRNVVGSKYAYMPSDSEKIAAYYQTYGDGILAPQTMEKEAA